MTEVVVAQPGRKRRRWIVVATVLVIVAAVVVAVGTVFGQELKSPEQAAADARPPSPSPVTAKAESRKLAEPVVVRGKVIAGSSVKVASPPGSTGDNAVVTGVKVGVGGQAAEGKVLAEISGRPVFGLVLPFPLYRDLTPDIAGPDVEQVQRALGRLGYRVPVNGKFDEASRAGLSRFYQARGYDPAAVSGAPSAKQNPGGTTPAPETPAALTPTVNLPRSSVVLLDSPRRKVTAVGVRVGAVLDDPKAILLELDGQPAALQVIANREQIGVLKAGQRAQAVDDTTGESAAAEVASVGTEPVTGADGTTGFAVRLKFAGEPPAVTDRMLRVSIADAESGAEVLAVPVTAVYSHADGSTFVTVLAGKDPVDVTVKTGKAAGGWTEVTPQDPAVLKVGVPVVVGVNGKGGS
ncbi:hypothetical protein [Amycolatopsis speibonae]|uniref:Peptidoglycan-binding protein n=1 Tax=Amycolatopsis speibonae TaxID=1450224 RepID=A0ABV7P3K1_9PSEU